MPKIIDLLSNEYANAYDLEYKSQYSAPKIYDANGDLSKRWYVYFSFRKTADAALVRFPNNFYAAQYLDKKDRLQWLKKIQRTLSILLKDGFDPYNPENKFEFDTEDNSNQSIEEAIKFKDQGGVVGFNDDEDSTWNLDDIKFL